MPDDAVQKLAEALNVILTKGESPAETPAETPPAEASATPAASALAAAPAAPMPAPAAAAPAPEIGVAVPGGPAGQMPAPAPGQRLNSSADLDRLFGDAQARDAYLASPGGDAEIDRVIAEETKGRV